MLAIQEADCHFCPSSHGVYPNINNCKCYYKCTDGVPLQKWCPPGQKFDVMSMSCSFPSKTVCAGNTVLSRHGYSERDPLSEISQDTLLNLITSQEINCLYKVTDWTWWINLLQNGRHLATYDSTTTSGGLARLPACPMASGPPYHKTIRAPRIYVD
ncbi:hypothetical protein AVEN_185439-1 [Araneus ventricosus]|uniref:Chitin-binding type-2 domain-containing protein n=1 Tax=Araneus ventricosus TaxID=182803 RepID=A0A4Y2IP41_ARAVE|nr:hypothetical protein AVEN_185439-1 [Araneus ventricosus]